MKFDVVVVGSGVGGYPAAAYLSDKGLRVAVVEEHYLGGECTNYGCVPSKALYSFAESVKTVLKMKSSVHYEWADVVGWVKSVVEDTRKGLEYLLESRGVSIYAGRGVVKAGRRIVVFGGDGRLEELEANHLIIAVGTDPVDIPAARFDSSGVLSNREALYLSEKPESLLIIGGGVVGVELANIFASLKTRVTIVEIMDQILPFTDRDIATAVKGNLQQLGVEVYEGTSVVRIERGQGEYVAELSNGLKVSAEKVVVAVGRRPKTSNIGLEEAGIGVDSKGFISVNRYMETTAPGVYAAGDVVGGPLLAHKAMLESIVAAKRILGEEVFAVDYKLVPITIFTGLEVASVGYTEKELTSTGMKFKRVKIPLAYLSAVKIKGYKNAFVKVLYDENMERVYGVHIVSPNASEVISSYLPLYMGILDHEKARRTPYPHLTVSESLRDLAEYVLGEPIHLLKR